MEPELAQEALLSPFGLVISYLSTGEGIFRLVQLLVLVVGAYLAFRQLKRASDRINLLRQINQKDLEWNKKIAAQQAVQGSDYGTISGPVHRLFGYMTKNEPIPLADINEKLETNEDARIELHRLLNFYEALARGVIMEIYDDQVIQKARRGAMIRVGRCFREYIENRQQAINPRAWECLVDVSARWEKEAKGSIASSE